MDRGRGRRGGAAGRGPQPTGRGGGQPSPSIGRGAGGRGQQSVNSSGGRGLRPDAPSSTTGPSYQSAPATAALRQEMGKMTIGSSSSQAPPAASPPPQLPPLSSKGVKNPPRRGYGTLGKKIVVKANHFLVEVADIDLHHYDVTITPEVLSKKVCRDIIAELVKSFSVSHLGKRKLAYDGRKSVYTAGELPFPSKDFVVKLADKDGARKEREFKVSIKFAAKADLHHLRQFLFNGQPDAPYETLQALDVVLREKPSTFYEPVGRSFFDPIFTRGELGNGLEYWKGFYQSLRPTQMGLSLNIDMSARAFFEPIKVTDFVMKYFSRDLTRPLSDQDRIKLKRVLRGLKVEVNHSKNMRRYKVSGVSTEPMQRLMFSLAESEEKTSVVQYFKDTYKITLRYPLLPALQAGNDSKPIYLPMELCKIVEGQRYSKKLNERQVTALLKATCQRPKDRERTISEMVCKNNYNNDELVNTEFGMRIRPELTSIEARVLDPPMLQYHASGQESRVAPRVGQWNMINKKMVNGGTVDFWTCINFSRNTNADVFVDHLLGMCISKGMVFNPDPLVPFCGASPSHIEKALCELHADSCSALVKMKSDKQLQLLIVILPDMTGSYGTIKRVCETELGIVSQCCQPRQAQKLNVQYMENVALKINVKVGGRNSVLEQAHLRNNVPLFRFTKAPDGTTTKFTIPTIIFGADVTHPAAGEDSSPSIAAVVASMDWPEVTKYRALVSAQEHRVEIIQDLYRTWEDPKTGTHHGGLIIDHLKAFYKSTRVKPGRIIFYRDGVSEGQFSQVLLYEMDAIRRACQALEAGYLPRVTFVVVQKRHHTRLFPNNHNDRSSTDKSGNILPGTVVDTKICHPTEFDFYLCSHAGIQGTSRPAHYHVLYDENGFDANHIQALTNSLCYTYARCTRSVSIVPPAYYAHLAAFRARYYIEGSYSDSGSTTAGGGDTREGNRAVRQLPVIKENVKEVMFYC